MNVHLPTNPLCFFICGLEKLMAAILVSLCTPIFTDIEHWRTPVTENNKCVN